MKSAGVAGCSSGEESRDQFSVADDHDGPTCGCVVFVGVVDAHSVVEAGSDVVG